jgi:transposase
MTDFVKKHEKESFECLTSIPGIGSKTATVLIAATQSMKGFDSAKQVSSYFGLCPRIVDSGTSVKGKAKICKMGMGMIWKLLYLCALSAKKYNRLCRELYGRLLAQGKKKKLALIAVANKLIKQAFSMLKNNLKYEDDFYAKKYLTH